MKDGPLLPAVIQDNRTGQVLMVGYQDAEARRLTAETGFVHFYSRSRQRLWMKGETSGNTLGLVSMSDDCDADAVLIRVVPTGPTCHTGAVSCFGSDSPAGTLNRLWETIERRRAEQPPGSYTVSLLEGGVDSTGRKLVEEAVELLLAAKDHDQGGPAARVTEEAADLLYHLMVLVAQRGLGWEGVLDVLERRGR